MPVKPWIMALDDPGDIHAPAGSIARARALRGKLRDLLHNRVIGVSTVLHALRAFEQEHDFAVLENPQGQPFASMQEFCTTKKPYGLGWDEREITALWQETRQIALGESR